MQLDPAIPSFPRGTIRLRFQLSAFRTQDDLALTGSALVRARAVFAAA